MSVLFGGWQEGQARSASVEHFEAPENTAHSFADGHYRTDMTTPDISDQIQTLLTPLPSSSCWFLPCCFIRQGTAWDGIPGNDLSQASVPTISTMLIPLLPVAEFSMHTRRRIYFVISSLPKETLPLSTLFPKSTETQANIISSVAESQLRNSFKKKWGKGGEKEDTTGKV